MQRWYNIQKSIHVILHISKRKDQNHMFISIDAKKHLIDTAPIYDKSTQQGGTTGSIPQMIKAIYKKSTVNIILIRQEVKAFP